MGFSGAKIYNVQNEEQEVPIISKTKIRMA